MFDLRSPLTFATLAAVLPVLGPPLLGITAAWARSLPGQWTTTAAMQTTALPPRIDEPPRPARKTRALIYRRSRLVRLANAPGLHVRTPSRAWGTPLMVRRLREVLGAYKLQFPDASPIWIHDLSHRRGGRMSPHVSHRTGRDVDIRVLVRRPRRYAVKATPRTLHVERTWYILKALVDTCDVELVFLDRRLQRVLYRHARRHGVPRATLGQIFQYPYRRPSGIVRHWKGHADHLHVRFRREGQSLRVRSARDYCAARPPGMV